MSDHTADRPTMEHTSIAEGPLSTAIAEYQRWLAATKGLSPNTLRSYQSDLASFIACLGADRPVRELDVANIVAYITEERRLSRANSTLRRRLSSLRGFTRWLADTGALTVDPVRDAAIRIPQPRRLPRAMSAAETAALLGRLRQTCEEADESSDRLAATCTLAAAVVLTSCGLRVSELLTLELGDIDDASWWIRVTGKGSRERRVCLADRGAAEVVTAYLALRQKAQADHPMVFVGGSGSPLTATTLRRDLSAAARDAGIGRHVTPHVLRHTAATLLVESGVDIRVIQRMLGHASLATTEIYAHVSDGALRRHIAEASVVSQALLTT